MKQALADGLLAVDEIHITAEQHGISQATIRRAYDDLGILAIKEKKFQGKWLWYTPEQQAGLMP